MLVIGGEPLLAVFLYGFLFGLGWTIAAWLWNRLVAGWG